MRFPVTIHTPGRGRSDANGLAMIGVLVNIIFRVVAAGALDMREFVRMRELLDIRVAGSTEPGAMNRSLILEDIDLVMARKTVFVFYIFSGIPRQRRKPQRRKQKKGESTFSDS